MGAGTSATELIFFITSVVIALSVVGGVFLNIESISTASVIGSRTLTEQLRTDITIINDPDQIPYSSNHYTFYVKNTGNQELGTQYVNVIIDGTIISESSLNKTIVNGDSMWFQGDILSINATTSLGTGNHNIRIITENGVEDTFSFRI